MAVADEIPPGTRYYYCLDGNVHRPDPASRFQPSGVHGASQVVDLKGFGWTDRHWRGLPLEEYVLYELHVGTYTDEGTFEAIIPYLEEIKELGVTAVELMPVAQFPGARNWGYDGAYPFAVQASYGGPGRLNGLVDACHQRGMAVVLDVVYNHLGPEGNYLNDFGPYFTDEYRSLWGRAVNFDGPGSDAVVQYFVENALQWVRDFHIDALRLDAIHGIIDRNARPFLEILSENIHAYAQQSGRRIYLIAESDLNDVRCLRPADCGGYGMDAQWSDDFHHALHALLTHETTGYYQDFGQLAQLGTAWDEGFVYSGQYSSYRQCRHGNSSRQVPAQQLVVFAQNHDQVGNRMLGDRLAALVSPAAAKLAAATVILSPFVPLLFMGEEWGERAPFQYFTSHGDPALIAAVRRGRREEFADFGWHDEPPDPNAESTFQQCKIDHGWRESEPQRRLRDLYRELIALRKTLPALAEPSKDRLEVRCWEEQGILQVRRWCGAEEAIIVANFSEFERAIPIATGPRPATCRLNTADRRWGGSANNAIARASAPADGAARAAGAETSVLTFALAEVSSVSGVEVASAAGALAMPAGALAGASAPPPEGWVTLAPLSLCLFVTRK